jgi:hypothetical protein
MTAAQTDLNIETCLQLQPIWKKENLRLVVFIQENNSRRIFGVGKFNLPKLN